MSRSAAVLDGQMAADCVVGPAAASWKRPGKKIPPLLPDRLRRGPRGRSAALDPDPPVGKESGLAPVPPRGSP